MEIDASTFSIQSYPKEVGGYELGNGIVYCFTKKPFIIHRLFCRLLLGWKWKDFN